VQRALKRRGWEQTAGNRKPAQIVERNRHAEMLSESAHAAHPVENLLPDSAVVLATRRGRQTPALA
jgi:hypothetical protein